ncbi:MAG TPA: glycosyl hydrolase [Longimicrobiales bacterium]|nr:glycosyl hydrolase [Longimicrobiales bacterium]
MALVTGTALASIALVLGLTRLGSLSEGPLSFALRTVGSMVGRVEGGIIQRIRGPGRTAELAWLEPLRSVSDSLRQPDRLLFGAYTDGVPSTLEGITDLERSLATTFPLIQLYTAWGDEPAQHFPRRVLDAIATLGSIPVVTWEPWLSTFEPRLHPQLPLRAERDRNGLSGVARGDYDFYIDAWAREAAAFQRPILVRFAHEMNDPYRYPWGPHNNAPQDFIGAWRRVVDRFRAAGATNVLWVWSPHVAYAGYEVYWPGDDYVDWVGTGVLNYGTVAYWSGWWSFQEIFGTRYDFLAGFGKPIMIAELASLTVGGDRADWYRQAFSDLGRYPAVRALLFFHVDDDRTVTRQALDWSFAGDSTTLTAVREGMRRFQSGPEG